jgi:hypothetical protein
MKLEPKHWLSLLWSKVLAIVGLLPFRRRRRDTVRLPWVGFSRRRRVWRGRRHDGRSQTRFTRADRRRKNARRQRCLKRDQRRQAMARAKARREGLLA